MSQRDATLSSETDAPPAHFALPRVSDVELAHALELPHWPPCPSAPFLLQQLWRPMPEAKFQPGTVWLAATNEALLVFAELSEHSAHTRATQDHEHLWELGDAFELFVQPFGAGEYFEFQVAPNGCLLQLHYPEIGAPRQDGIDRYIRRDRLIERAVKIDAAAGSWRVALRLPVAPLLAGQRHLRGDAWRLSACRNDYDETGRDCISSTSPFTRPDFHRIGEWPVARLEGGFWPGNR